MQHSLFLPIAAEAGAGEPLLVELWHKGAFAGQQFLGQAVTTLGEALRLANAAAEAAGGTGAAAAAVALPPLNCCWLPLCKRRAADAVAGEVCLSFEALTAATAARAAAEADAAMDPEAIAAALPRRALHVRLHGLSGLRANGLCGGGGSAAPAPAARGARPPPRARVLHIRFGRLCLEKPLLPLLGGGDGDGTGDGSGSGSGDGGGAAFELPIGEEVLIPLARALRPGAAAALMRRDGLLDVKICVRGASHTIAKVSA